MKNAVNGVFGPSLYPYIITRIVPAFYHVIILPDIAKDELITLARSQYAANRLQTCLVLSDNEAIYIDGSGETVSTHPPMSDLLISDKLKPCTALAGLTAHDPTFKTRRDALAEIINFQRQTGYLMGDLTKGGRRMTTQEYERLSGPNPQYENVPNGLDLCETCSMFRGECLDPGENFKGMVMTAYCKCQNNNRCATCLQLLYEKKLNANYYNPKDNSIWHVPGFSGFSHECHSK